MVNYIKIVSAKAQSRFHLVAANIHLITSNLMFDLLSETKDLLID